MGRVESTDFTDRNRLSTVQSCLYLSATSGAGKAVFVRSTHFPSRRAPPPALARSISKRDPTGFRYRRYPLLPTRDLSPFFSCSSSPARIASRSWASFLACSSLWQTTWRLPSTTTSFPFSDEGSLEVRRSPWTTWYRPARDRTSSLTSLWLRILA